MKFRHPLLDLHPARSLRAIGIALALGAGAGALTACNTEQVLTHGAVISQDQIDLIPAGSSKDQVLLALGTPSTTGQFEEEVYYYISQRKEKKFAFAKAQLVDQRILAVYFDETDTVSRVADYGLKDGKVFDFISRTTPTGGRDLTFLGQILSGTTSGKLPTAPTRMPGERGPL